MKVSLSKSDIPKPVVELCHRLQSKGYRAWVVGGCLRDMLLHRTPEDWDIATTATPEQVNRVFTRTIPTGIQHGTVTVIWKGKSYEVTTLRGERGYSDGRHPDEVFFVQEIDRDLARRDFTLNAIAFDPLEEWISDPFRGIRDLEKRLLRTVGDPLKRFREDGLRVLRTARFSATHGLRIDDQTLQAIPFALDAFRKVSHERVRDEWLKIMLADSPSVAFEIMSETGMLGITFPELLEQVGCVQNKCHAYDVWNHSMLCLDLSVGNPVHRMAALLHDLGKPRTRMFSEKHQDYTFHGHERIGAEIADEWLRAYRFSNGDRQRIVHLIRHHLVCYTEKWSDAAVRRFINRTGMENIDELIALARADIMAKGRPVEEELSGLLELRRRIEKVVDEGSAFGFKQLAINGHDIIHHLHIQPGPMVGRILERILEQVIENPELNRPDLLLSLVDQFSQEEDG